MDYELDRHILIWPRAFVHGHCLKQTRRTNEHLRQSFVENIL